MPVYSHTYVYALCICPADNSSRARCATRSRIGLLLPQPLEGTSVNPLGPGCGWKRLEVAVPRHPTPQTKGWARHLPRGTGLYSHCSSHPRVYRAANHTTYTCLCQASPPGHRLLYSQQYALLLHTSTGLNLRNGGASRQMSPAPQMEHPAVMSFSSTESRRQ
jgi:hypothetical protein